MFDISFGELLVVFVLGLIVLGPQRLPVAVKTVAGWLRAIRSLASSVQNELAQELKLQELQDSLKKVEKASMGNLTPELKASMDELREATASMKRAYTSVLEPEKESDEAHTIHNPVKTDRKFEDVSQEKTEAEAIPSSDTREELTGDSASVSIPPARDIVTPEISKSPELTQPPSEKN